MSYDAKASLRLTDGGRWYSIRLQSRPSELGDQVELELVRNDAKPAPVLNLRLDDAKAFLRQWQGAVDEAHRRAKARGHRSSDGCWIDGPRGPRCGCQSCRHDFAGAGAP